MEKGIKMLETNALSRQLIWRKNHFFHFFKYLFGHIYGFAT